MVKLKHVEKVGPPDLPRIKMFCISKILKVKIIGINEESVVSPFESMPPLLKGEHELSVANFIILLCQGHGGFPCRCDKITLTLDTDAYNEGFL